MQGVKGTERELSRKTDRMNREMEKSMLYTFISLVSKRFLDKKKKKNLGNTVQISEIFLWGQVL